ncbi:MAG: SPOR domain-containing protein [Holosporales bacterium]|jgi:hypothetical protein|nr:SPOR domain-containing protein [Holosporales bacterium]
MHVDDEYPPEHRDDDLAQKKHHFSLLLGGTGVVLVLLVVLWKYLPQQSRKIPTIKAPETPAKIYPKEEPAKDPLQENSVYNRIATTPSQKPEASSPVKPLPSPEAPVPSLQGEESMELTPEEQTQLKSLVDGGETEEEEDIPLGKAEPLQPYPLKAQPVPQKEPSSEGKQGGSPTQAPLASSQKTPPLQPAENAPLSSEQKTKPLSRKGKTALSQQSAHRVKKEEKKEKPLFSHTIKGFKVQVASLETREHAVQEWKRLKKKPAFHSVSGEIVRVDLGRERGIRHRVYVGPFSSKQAAQRFVEKLKALHMDTLVVAP